jgi:hypothetical protein
MIPIISAGRYFCTKSTLMGILANSSSLPVLHRDQPRACRFRLSSEIFGRDGEAESSIYRFVPGIAILKAFSLTVKKTFSFSRRKRIRINKSFK